MSEYKREIGATVAIAVLLAAALGAIAIYSFPGASTSTAALTGVTTSTSSVTTEVNLSRTIFSTTTGPILPVTTSVTPAHWDTGRVVTLVLTSSLVQSYISTAYSYDVATLGSSPSNPNLIILTVNVTVSLVVQGNWTTGYDLSYTGVKTLNATVQFIPPASYVLTGVSVANLPDVNESIAFDSQQQAVIGVALSNTTVRGLLGSGPFYVASVTPVPIANGTYQSDFFTYLYQVNGTRTVGVFVNSGITAVVNAYTDTRVQSICFGTEVEGAPPSGLDCFSSPWNSTS